MEEVLDVYARPYDSQYPVLCMDEQPIQLLKETRAPIAGTKKHARRVDYEYERAGTASIFMFCEPLAGWRHVSVRERRTKVDWAQEMEPLLRVRYASAKKVILLIAVRKVTSLAASRWARTDCRARGTCNKVGCVSGKVRISAIGLIGEYSLRWLAWLPDGRGRTYL
jgi:hypothetical protein